MSKRKELDSDLQIVDSCYENIPALEKGETIRFSIVDNVCDKLNITTPAAKEFIRFSLANALLMERKQLDYGPRNISEFGSFGCVVRMSDKWERIKHLFKNRRKNVVNESITDSFRDFSNYAIIAMMVDEGKWPTE